MLSEGSQMHNVWFHSYEVSITGQMIETESQLVVAQGKGREESAVPANGYGVSFWDDEVLELVMMVASLCE